MSVEAQQEEGAPWTWQPHVGVDPLRRNALLRGPGMIDDDGEQTASFHVKFPVAWIKQQHLELD